MLPSVDFCGLDVTRLVLGANPFGGFSHQSPERNQEMIAFYTKDRIKETWRRAEAVGINTMVTNNLTAHVLQAVREYLADGGALQWIAQVARPRQFRDTHPASLGYAEAIDEVVNIGCSALYLHGGVGDEAYATRDEEAIRVCCDHARSRGVPVGVASHSPEAHAWLHGLDVADFHVVCFFNCGSLHSGKGDRFQLTDMAPATEQMRRIPKPCIGYKIMGAGRIDAHMAFEYAFDHIKPTDVVNVGMHRGDKDDMVEENAGMVRDILEDRDGRA